MQVVGYLVEELRDAKNYAAFKHDMTEANIFIGSLIFIEELADKVSASLYCSHPGLAAGGSSQGDTVLDVFCLCQP